MRGDANEFKGAQDVEAGDLDAAVALDGARHFENTLDVGEVDLAQVSFGESDGSADEASGEGDWCVSEYRGRQYLRAR
jgi:hypothetical protein